MNFLLDHDVPDDVSFTLRELGHDVVKLRELSTPNAPDADVLKLAAQRGSVLITCNRDDFLAPSHTIQHAGLIILVRRRSRILERAALVRLLDTAGEAGICRNINYA